MGFGGDGDGWVRCAAGHRHWGRFGAAGLLLRDAGRTVLQHRAPWTHEGGVWGLPGGARDSHEDAVATALREAAEEAALRPGDIRPTGVRRVDHGGWHYATVTARTRVPVHPAAANAESSEVAWHADQDIAALPLHPGLAAAWPSLRTLPAPVVLVVPWRVEGLAGLARRGIRAGFLPPPLDAGPLDLVLPHIVVAGGSVMPDRTQRRVAWWARALEIDAGAGVAARVRAEARAGTQVLVVGEHDDLPDGTPTVPFDWLYEVVATARRPAV